MPDLSRSDLPTCETCEHNNTVLGVFICSKGVWQDKMQGDRIDRDFGCILHSDLDNECPGSNV